MPKKKTNKPTGRPAGRPRHDRLMEFVCMEAQRRFTRRPLSWLFGNTRTELLVVTDDGVREERQHRETARRRYYSVRKRHLSRQPDGMEVFDPAIEQLIGIMVVQYCNQTEGTITA